MSINHLTSAIYLVFIVLIGHKIRLTAGTSCGEDWISFEDSKCLRFYDNFETKEVAEETCASIPTEPLNTSRLISIKSQPEQDFLNAWIFQELGVLNSIWLNGDRLNDSHFVWRDGDWMSFTNWDDGFPTNQTANLCMEMSPKAGRQGELDATEDGKWKDVPCSKRNLVVCEKNPTLTVPELQEILFQLRDNPVPVGFIYVQLPFHPSPQTLWPNLIWRNVSSSYAGLFYRAEGGLAANFGSVQAESCNLLSNVNFGWMTSVPNSISVPESGWSPHLNVDLDDSSPVTSQV
ncbi:Alpha-N-acetylgalactosamine-specific lectin [Folsomia candida]|uniref:Alpha-N-acetylgalactosamine-specific lectin n=1 Tax=Folsomia candida TaxID=158441 RepID=A0A226ECX4_FOLCA|nr:Alpha-N-acetylgalactosamine-specific lectin [Folsomia candida]